MVPVSSALDALRDSHELVELLTRWQWQAVEAARRDGASWAQVASATGTTIDQARAEYVAVLDRLGEVDGRCTRTYLAEI